MVDGLRLDEILKDSDVRESTDGEIVVTSPERVQKKTRRKSRERRKILRSLAFVWLGGAWT